MLRLNCCLLFVSFLVLFFVNVGTSQRQFFEGSEEEILNFLPEEYQKLLQTGERSRFESIHPFSYINFVPEKCRPICHGENEWPLVYIVNKSTKCPNSANKLMDALENEFLEPSQFCDEPVRKAFTYTSL